MARIGSMVARSAWLSTGLVALFVAAAVLLILRARRHLARRTKLRLLLDTSCVVSGAILIFAGYVLVETINAPSVTVQALYDVSGVPTPATVVTTLIAVAVLVVLSDLVRHSEK